MPLKSFDIIFSSLILVYSILLILNTFKVARMHMVKNKTWINYSILILYFIFFILLIFYSVKYRFIFEQNLIYDYGALYKIVIISILVQLFVYKAVSDYLEKYINTNLSENAIKEGVDYLDGGLCYFNKDGRILLRNITMNMILKSIPNVDVYDGFSIWRAIKEKSDILFDDNFNDNTVIVSFNGETFYKFVLNEKKIEDNNIYEIIATDVTIQEQLNKKLINENYRLEQMNRRLRQYNRNIEKVISEEEILNAKISFHDNYGKMLLAAKKSFEENSDGKKQCLQLWKQNLNLVSLRTNDEKEASYDFNELVDVAKAIGVTIHFNNWTMISNRKLYEIFFTAIHECLTNTISHAKGKNLYIKFNIEEDFYNIELKNDGKQPDRPITLGGGLTNMLDKVKSINGSMKIIYEPEFKISITLPIEEETYER